MYRNGAERHARISGMNTSLVTWDPEGVAAWAAAQAEEERHDPVVMIQSLRGFIDAGHTGRLCVEHLLADAEPVRVASFDVDRLIDYRSRRPEMVFQVNQWESYDAPTLHVDMMRDQAGRPYLLLHGSEPDVLWEQYVTDVMAIITKLGVDITVGAHGIPMAAPHTRPLLVTVHGTDPDALPANPPIFGSITVPGSAQNLLEYRLGEAGGNAANAAVHVPHYLAQSHYPHAARRALEEVSALTGLQLDVDGFAEAIDRADEEIGRQAEESEDIQALIAALEEQYDAMAAARDGVMPEDGKIPTADEIGAEFERFLADRDGNYPGSS